ncbi:phage tail protein [Bacillus wiedmannii]|uniref:phage tail protein n=1 Tax=Bacillus wiedmannii TaxID=1890302 RepID=UPI0021CE1121|nr:phage tail protein [Bacillus wiedmannii]MCU5596793.1 phage tail protein [Bacillus wiedmannii]
MYRVTISNDGVETVIHDSSVNELKVSSGIIKKEISLIDSFNFSFYMNNPGYGKIKPLSTRINVLNTRTGEYEFEGRVLGPNKNMDNEGLHSDSYVCEGEMGYLHDSVQRHFEFRGTPLELFTSIIQYHNSQVEQYKQFQVGKVTATNSTNNLYLYLSAEKDTFDTLKEKLIDKLDGELQIRKVNGVRFLDLLDRTGVDKDTEIRIAKNLISMSCDIDPTQIVTRLTPLGTRIASKEEGATDASEARLTIESVNKGLPYIDDKELIKEFGIQGKSVTWDDVTLVENLLSKGKEWLGNQKAVHVQYKISAVDLFLIGLDIDSFETGNSYPVVNPIMGINERLRIIGKSLNINSPQDASLTVGDKFKTLNQYQSDLKKSTNGIVSLQNTVSEQNTKISTLVTTLSDTEQELQSLKKGIETADLKGISKAVLDLSESLQIMKKEISNLPTSNVIMEIQQKVENHSSAIQVISQKLDVIESANEMNGKGISKLQSDYQNVINRLEILEKGGV